MLNLAAVMADPALGLRWAGTPGGNPEIAWAHVSELADPGPWLAGRELLLTTGLQLFQDASSSREYCARVAEAGISALGLSTGPSLPHSEVPQFLIDAATAAGLPLVHIPENTPLERVVRFVSDSLNAEQTEPLRRALIAQRQLAEAAISVDGISSVLSTLQESTAVSVSVRDQSLRHLASVGDDANAQYGRLKAEILDRFLKDRTWSITDETTATSTQVFPLSTQERRYGVLIATKNGPMTYFDKALIGMVASLLGVLLALRESNFSQLRRVRGQVVEALISGKLTDVEAALRLAKVGITCSMVQVVLLPLETGESQLEAMTSQLEKNCGNVLTSRKPARVVVLICDPTPHTHEVLAEVIRVSGSGPVGVGMSMPPARADLSLKQALRAQSVARRRGIPSFSLDEAAGYRAMLLLGEPLQRMAFSDSVLAPLDAHDASHKTDLENTLNAYLNSASSIEVAARELGIHRHTMRARLEKISSITGRNLSTPGDLLELWLACEFRAMAADDI